MQRLFRGFEFIIFVLAIIAICMGFIGLYLKLFIDPPFPSILINAPFLMAMVLVMAVRMRETSLGALSAFPYILIGLLSIVSYRWSMMPAVTLKEAIPGTIYVLYISCMAWRYSWRELLNGLWIAMTIMMLGSYILYFGVPSMGSMEDVHVGAMAGLWPEKNAAGQVGAFGALLSLSRLMVSPRTAMGSTATFVLFTGMLLLSTSKTALVAYMVGCLGVGWVFLMRRNRPVFYATTWLTIFGGIMITTWMQSNVETVLALLGRNGTFTGRAEIWNAVQISLNDRPLLGHGYAAFWNEDSMGSTMSYVVDELWYFPFHSHNSYIEMKLTLGEVGAVLLVGSIGCYFLVSIFKVRKTHGAYFAIPFFLAAVIIGTFESVLAFPHNFAGCMIVLVAAKMMRPVLTEERIPTVAKIHGWVRRHTKDQRGGKSGAGSVMWGRRKTDRVIDPDFVYKIERPSFSKKIEISADR